MHLEGGGVSNLDLYGTFEIFEVRNALLTINISGGDLKNCFKFIIIIIYCNLKSIF